MRDFLVSGNKINILTTITKRMGIKLPTAERAVKNSQDPVRMDGAINHNELLRTMRLIW